MRGHDWLASRRHTVAAVVLLALTGAATVVHYYRRAAQPIDVRLDAGSTQPRVRVVGFSDAEGWGRWSLGSEVVVSVSPMLPASFRLILELRGFGPNVGAPLVLEVEDQRRQVAIPADISRVAVGFSGVPFMTERITLRIPRPTSPFDLGLGDDARKLGIGVARIVIIPETHAN